MSLKTKAPFKKGAFILNENESMFLERWKVINYFFSAGTPLQTPLQVGLPHPSTPVNGGGTTVTTPLATSSPPIDRSQPNVIGSQHSLGLPFTTSTRTSLHDYENMRYPASSSSSGVPAVRKRGRSNNNGRPPSDEFGQLHRNSTVIDGELLLKKGQIAPVPDAVSLVSEGRI